MTTINTLDVSLLTIAIEAILTESTRTALNGVLVQRSEEIPTEPPDGGWIGIYRNDDRFVPRTLGVASGFRQQESDLVCLLQACDLSSGANCEIRLEAMLQATISELLTDTSLRNTVANLGAITARRDRYEKLGDCFVQYAAIFLTAIRNVEVIY